MKNPKNVRRGRRARQRGAELQRQAVRMAKEAGLEASAFDRDWETFYFYNEDSSCKVF